MSTCVGCSQEVEIYAAFCQRCGTPNPDAKTIPTPNSGETTEHIPVDDLRVRLQAALGVDFHVERPLGEGGFAVVFLVHDRKLSRRIAVKVLRPEFTASQSGVRRFVREAESAASLNHPHILSIFFVGQGEGLVYFGMSLVDGESLDALLAREGQLAEAEVVRLGSAVADALAEAHANGLVHRDIKPANILLQGRDRRPLVTDFGIAKAATGAEDKLTGTGAVIGSPHYMSPEQAGGSSDIDHRSDIYSLGIVLWQMLAGELPFDAPDTRGILMQHLTQPLPSLRARRPSVRAELAVVVERCAAKVREDRFASASELAEALRTALSAKPAPPARVERRPRWIIGGALLLVVAAAATLGLLYRSRLGAPPQQQSDIANAESVRTTAPVIAVLPFEVSGNSDTAQGRTTARLLTNALTIDFDVQTVDVNRFLSLWTSEKRSIGALLDSNAAFAWLQGANQVVYGSSVQVGDQLRLTVDVYDTRDLVRLGQVKQTGDADSLLTLVDSLAGAVARAFCQRPEFNPGNLCFDSAPLPSAPIVVPYMGQPPSAPAKVFVRVTADGAYGDALPSSAPMEILAEALPVLRTARYVPARKAGRPVAAWAEVELTVRPPDLSVSPRSAVESLSIGVDQAALITLGSRPLAAMTINGRPVRGNPVANYRVRAGRIRVQFRVTDSSGVWVADTVLTAGPGQTRNFGRIPLRRP